MYPVTTVCGYPWVKAMLGSTQAHFAYLYVDFSARHSSPRSKILGLSQISKPTCRLAWSLAKFYYVKSVGDFVVCS